MRGGLTLELRGRMVRNFARSPSKGVVPNAVDITLFRSTFWSTLERGNNASGEMSDSPVSSLNVVFLQIVTAMFPSAREIKGTATILTALLKLMRESSDPYISRRNKFLFTTVKFVNPG